MDKKKRLKVLMELRPCFEGFAGIPQETRLVFHALNNLENIETTGLLLHGVRRLWPGLPRKKTSARLRLHRKVFIYSRLALSAKQDPLRWWDKVFSFVDKKVESKFISLKSFFGGKIKTYDFDSTDFGDFIWQMLFSKTLAVRDFDEVRTARYASMRPSYEALGKVSMGRMGGIFQQFVPMLDTRGFDAFLAQTPWPTRVTRGTQLVVRYHDAIPLYMPHTISNARIHQQTHMANLMISQRKGIFACTSDATRTDLLKIYPNLEKRSVVIPDIVSHEYYEQSGSPEYIANIVRNHINDVTEPKFLTSREKENFYHKNLMAKPIRYIMMVSSIEPRKNHMKLIAAWDYLKNHGMPDLKLIIVGERGWDYSRILEAMAPWQQRGELFHIHCVPSGQLRILYNGAEAVVCPSVAEGFDLSGIEAMLCGGAVVASDIQVHRDVYQNACEYFNPYSMMQLAKAVENVIHPDRRNRREELIAAGLRHAPSYRRENIMPHWQALFEKIRAGEFKRVPRKIYSLNPETLKPSPPVAEKGYTTSTGAGATESASGHSGELAFKKKAV